MPALHEIRAFDAWHDILLKLRTFEIVAVIAFLRAPEDFDPVIISKIAQETLFLLTEEIPLFVFECQQFFNFPIIGLYS